VVFQTRHHRGSVREDQDPIRGRTAGPFSLLRLRNGVRHDVAIGLDTPQPVVLRLCDKEGAGGGHGKPLGFEEQRVRRGPVPVPRRLAPCQSRDLSI